MPQQQSTRRECRQCSVWQEVSSVATWRHMNKSNRITQQTQKLAPQCLCCIEREGGVWKYGKEASVQGHIHSMVNKLSPSQCFALFAHSQRTQLRIRQQTNSRGRIEKSVNINIKYTCLPPSLFLSRSLSLAHLANKKATRAETNVN